MALDAEFPALLAAAGDGSEEAFDTLYREVGPGLLRYLRAMEPTEAEDLAADVWLAIAGQLGKFAGDENGFRALVFTIARRRVVDHRRRRYRRRTDLVPNETLTDRPGREETEALVIELLDAQSAVDQLVRRLPPAQAEVVLLRVIGGLGVNHVASILGRSPGAVRILQHRALRRLRA
jgi:RNA polymerase sigma-70 factor (ECF subfamily)